MIYDVLLFTFVMSDSDTIQCFYFKELHSKFLSICEFVKKYTNLIVKKKKNKKGVGEGGVGKRQLVPKRLLI